MGRKGRKGGIKWEDAVVEENKWIAAQDQATAFLVPEHAKVMSRRRGTSRIKGFMQGSTFCDFAGYQHRSGRFIGFDAKKTSAKTSWAFPKPDHKQIRWLKHVVEQGGVGFFYLARKYQKKPTEESGFALEFDRYLLPVDAQGRVAKVEGKKSVNFKQAAEDGYQLGPSENWYDAAVRLGLLRANPSRSGMIQIGTPLPEDL